MATDSLPNRSVRGDGLAERGGGYRMPKREFVELGGIALHVIEQVRVDLSRRGDIFPTRFPTRTAGTGT